MDIYRIIQELERERERILRIIESLEGLPSNAPARAAAPAGKASTRKKRRGRKSMDGAARKEVSERMRRYWANRRLQQHNAALETPEPEPEPEKEKHASAAAGS